MIESDDTEIPPTVYDMTVSVDLVGNTWVHAPDVVVLLRAFATATRVTGGEGVSYEDIAIVIDREADALDLWIREVSTGNDSV